MKFKRSILSVAVLASVLGLSGCNDDDDNTIAPTPEPVPTAKADLIIGLGLQVNYESCNSRLLLQQRVDKAYEVSLTKENPVFSFAGRANPTSLEKCFDSFGKGLTEAQAMKDYIMEKYGVSADKIILEELSTSTDENAKYLMPLLEEYAEDNNVVFVSKDLVTSGYHNHRQSWKDQSDNSSTYFFNRDFGEDTFVDGVNVHDSSVLAKEAVWSADESLIAQYGNSTETSIRIAGDVNNDSKADVVFLDKTTGAIKLYISDGVKLGQAIELATAFSGLNNLAIIDMDGDGFKDLVGTDDNGTIFAAVNTGTNDFKEEVVLGSVSDLIPAKDLSENPDVMFGNIDGDSKGDMVIVANSGLYTVTSGIVLNEAYKSSDTYGINDVVSPLRPLTKFGDLNSDYPRFLADVNGDGKDDLVAYGYQEIYVSLNEEGVFGEKTKWLSNDAEGNGYNFTTGSNHAELVLGVGWGDKKWNNTYPRGVADVNGDGFADIWAIGEHGVYVAWAADIDRDGEADHFENLNSVWVYESKWRHNGGNDTEYQQYTNYRGWNHIDHPRQFADMDGDGRDDLIGFGEAQVFVSISE